MLSVKKILVPRDFSACGDEALHYALDLARRVGASVHLLFVEVLYADPYYPASEKVASEETMQARLLEGVKDGLPGQAGATVPLACAVRRDVSAAVAIVEYAGAEDIDLIVMGTHGRRGLRRLLLGSTAEEVVRTAPCPVLIVRHEEEAAPGPHGQPALLVPVDFSQHARVALHHAKEMAGLFNARLSLLHVVEEQLHPAFYNTGVLSVYDLIPNLEAQVREELETFYRETKGPDVPMEIHVRHGHAAHEIVSFAEEEAPLLIVMSTHGLRGVGRFLMGSVAEKVVRLSPVPVLTMKSFSKRLLTQAAEVGGEAVESSAAMT